MRSLEKETREYLKEHFYLLQDNTNNRDLDFYIDVDHQSYFLEVKEKRQKYNMNNWKTDIPQEHLFILDDLCARKCFFAGPYGAILIRDNITNEYYFCPMITLFFMKKERANRKLEDGTLSGKIFIDLRQCQKLYDIKELKEVIQKQLLIKPVEVECYNPFSEEITIQGTIRNAKQMKQDFLNTR